MSVFFKKKRKRHKPVTRKPLVRAELALPRVNLKLRRSVPPQPRPNPRRRRLGHLKLAKKVLKSAARARRVGAGWGAKGQKVLVERVSRSLDSSMRNPAVKNEINRRFEKERRSYRPKLFNNLNIRDTLGQLTSSKNYYFFVDFNRYRNLSELHQAGL